MSEAERGLPAAAVKRDFRRLLDAAERGQRTLILRHGRPVAELGRIRTLPPETPTPRQPGGLLGLLGLFADWETIDADLAEIVAERRGAADRPPPDLD